MLRLTATILGMAVGVALALYSSALAQEINPGNGLVTLPSGLSQGTADARYVNVAGDTMTGDLFFGTTYLSDEAGYLVIEGDVNIEGDIRAPTIGRVSFDSQVVFGNGEVEISDGLNLTSQLKRYNPSVPAEKSALDFFDGIKHKRSTITTSTTLDADYHTVYCDSSGGDVTITLPAANEGIDLWIKKTSSDTNNCVLTPQGGESIEGASTVTLTAQYASRMLRPTAGIWLVFGAN